MPDRWQVIFEVTFDILEWDSPESARSALLRAKLLMDKLITDGGFAHYHILGQPKKVVEFD